MCSSTFHKSSFVERSICTLAALAAITMFVMPLSQARADHWTITSPPLFGGPYDQQSKDDYLTQWGDYFSGTVTRKNSGNPNGGYLYYPDPYVTAPSSDPFGIAANRYMLSEHAGGPGGVGQITASGKVRYKVKWQRRTIPNAGYTAMIPDPTDNPPKYLFLWFDGTVRTESQDANGDSNNRHAGNESASASLSLDGSFQTLYDHDTIIAAQNSGAYTFASSSLKHAIKIDVNGQEEFWTPWIKVEADAALTDNRTYSQGYPGYPQYTRTFWSDGNVSATGNTWTASDLQVGLSPSPDNIALDDGSTKGLNQYLITEGIPTSIGVRSSDEDFVEWLRTHSSWTLSGPSPALRPLLDNYKESGYDSATVGPQHPSLEVSTPPDPTPTPDRGLKFDIQTKANPANTTDSTADYDWKFPADNTKFGERTLNHVVGGLTIPAQVALFFPSNGHQHPRGGPEGYVTVVVNGDEYAGVGPYFAPPNWVYYYDKEWKNPWGFELNYWSNPSHYSYSFDRTAKIFIGEDAHAAMTPEGSPNFNSRPTYIFGVPPVSPAYPSGTIQCIGEQYVRGLDVYVRVITHESVHILQRKAIENGAVDSDSDRCPDDLEGGSTGLIVGDKDSANWGGNYSGYGDGETISTMYEKDLLAPTDNDWANDGFNWKGFRATPPNRIQRTVALTYPAFNGITGITYPDPHAALKALLPTDLKNKTP